MKIRKILAVFLAVLILCSGQSSALAAEDETAAMLADTAAYVHKTVKNPQVDSVGGEWAVIGLARSGYAVPDSYFAAYYQTVEAFLKNSDGIIHDKKYSDYSRVILALTAAGYNPTNVAGYDLTLPLADFEKTIWQGLNGPIFALLALDSGNYAIPHNPEAAVQATRTMYVDEILSRQLPDGGFSLLGKSESATDQDNQADPDITAMALQALSKYRDRQEVKKAVSDALVCLSQMQNNQGGYTSWNGNNVESVVQVLVALTELGIPVDDAEFVKNGHTLADNLRSYYIKGQGFRHGEEGGSNQKATEQALYALAAIQRAAEGKHTLYRMTDVKKAAIPGQEEDGIGLPDKHADIRLMPVISSGKTFADISVHPARSSIDALAIRGIINGKNETIFDPDATMTRAEFAAIIIRGLGLTPQVKAVFTDVPANAWHAGFIGAAHDYEIVAGISPNTFNPQGTITREEAAVMTARAAKLAGMSSSLDEIGIRNILAQFSDYTTTALWARADLAFCYQENILSQVDLEIRPKEAIKRHEVAEMLFRLLGAANLL